MHLVSESILAQNLIFFLFLEQPLFLSPFIFIFDNNLKALLEFNKK